MSIGSDRNAIDLLAHAASWRLASLLLERPRPGWRDEIEKLSCEVADQELSTVAEVTDETEGVYHWFFGPGGVVSPREVSYCGFEDPGHLMADLASFYDGFSFRPQREEPIDHISVETGFVGYLFLKEAYARTEGNQEAAKVAEQGRELFIKEHVARCAEGMEKRTRDGASHIAKVLLWVMRMARESSSDALVARGDHGF
jgi:nitrate reductase assembly molybdenum cofactor insertion protein NarJ